MSVALTGILKRVGFLSLMVGLCTGSVYAHHAFTAEFDPNKPIAVTGKVTMMLWSNPHAWIYIDVEGPNGEIVNWKFETRGANGLLRRGWRSEDLVAGTVLVIEGWQARDGAPTGNASSITFSDGSRLFAGTSNPNAQDNQ